MQTEFENPQNAVARAWEWLRRFVGARPGAGSGGDGGQEASLEDKDSYYRVAARSRFPGKRILVMEDNAACCEILQNFMARWEMEVTMVVSCRAALAALAKDGGFDFAVLDHTVGDGTGDDVARAMRRAGLAASCSMVSLTGNRYLPDSKLYHATIEKPISPETLRSTLIDLLDERARG